MNREQIKAILPHREPMLLLDSAEVVEGEGGTKRAVGTYTVTGDEYFVQGHFPKNPVVPGVIQCEMMAQTCCVLFAGQTKGATPYFTGLNNVKFKRVVNPGDTLRFECEITRARSVFFFATGKGYVGDELAVKGEFSFALVPDESAEKAGE